MYEKRLMGVVIPMITPMNEDSTVDDASLKNFVNFLVDAGSNPLEGRCESYKLLI